MKKEVPQERLNLIRANANLEWQKAVREIPALAKEESAKKLFTEKVEEMQITMWRRIEESKKAQATLMDVYESEMKRRKKECNEKVAALETQIEALKKQIR
jgi:thymidylate synthase